MQLTPIYKSAAFWSTVVGAIVAIVVGLGYEAEAEALGAVAAIVIGWLAARGYVAAKAAQAGPVLETTEDGKQKVKEINF